MLVPNHAKYKNAADITMIIDAVDILYSKKEIDGFCIVSSDNHFIGLAARIRKEGAFMVGIGSSETEPLFFRNECDVFRHVERLPQSDNPDPAFQKALSETRSVIRNHAVPARGRPAAAPLRGSRLSSSGWSG